MISRVRFKFRMHVREYGNLTLFNPSFTEILFFGVNSSCMWVWIYEVNLPCIVWRVHFSHYGYWLTYFDTFSTSIFTTDNLWPSRGFQDKATKYIISWSYLYVRKKTYTPTYITSIIHFWRLFKENTSTFVFFTIRFRLENLWPLQIENINP